MTFIDVKPPSMWETFLYPISFNIFVAKADLPPAAQNNTISLLGSIIPFWIKALFGSSWNSRRPLEIFIEFSSVPDLSS